MVPVASLTTLGSLDDACGYSDTYPTLRHPLFDPTQPLQFHLPLQSHLFYHPDLTCYLQYCELQGGPIAKMASEQDTMDMERFQRLSDTYQPDVQGPLIRDKCSIQALIDEFNNADPAYVMKTVSLAASYSDYRPIKGDGQCGWRAVVFGYFESLLSQELDKVVAEKQRLQGFTSTLVAVGWESSMVELFVEQTMELFDSLHEAMRSANRSDLLLLEAFNDEARSNSIVFHFKLLTSATMRLNPDQYQPYLEQPLFEYCRSNVEAFGQEIEQISLQALTDGVIAPALINVVVMYLDRSEGSEVTPHQLVASASPDWPTITLLYRPGHYDIIYKGTTPIQVRLTELGTAQPRFTPTNAFGADICDLQILSRFNEDQSLMQHFPGGDYSSPLQSANMLHTEAYTPIMSATITTEQHMAPISALASPSTYDVAHMHSDVSADPPRATTESYGGSSHGGEYVSYGGAYPTSSPLFHPPMLLPAQHCSSPPAPSPVSSVSPGPAPRKQGLQIRLSQGCYEMGQRHHEVAPFETSPFKNSPYNRNHFANPDFQPMMWKAEHDYN